MASDLRVVSLFAGAGGMDLGFVRTGFDVVFAGDWDADSRATYAAQFGCDVCAADVSRMDGSELPACDVIIGGPPCQGFSVAGHMNPKDPRSKMVWHFARLVARVRPRAFVMENVKALAALRRWDNLKASLATELESAGHYQVRMHILNARDYGVPQSRERVFFIGTAEGVRPVDEVERPNGLRMTARAVLEGFPPPGAPPNLGVCRAKVTPAKTPILRKSPYAGMLFNGQGRPIRLDSQVNTLPASMGGNRTPIVDEEELRRGRPSWVEWYHRRLMRGGRPVRKVPDRLRRLTLAEAAAFQTFPLAYPFRGSQSSRFRQIGNAVPPRLAAAVAKAVLGSLTT